MARRSSFKLIFIGYGMVVGLALLTAGLVLIHGGRLLNFGFPLMATMVAGALFTTRRSVYAAFVWWIWLFTPLVRRLVDYQTSYHNISPVMVTPLLVTGFALVAVMRRPRVLLKRRMLPFLMLLATIVYATIVGAITNTPLGALYDMANWLLPLVFCVFLQMYPVEYPEIRDSLVFAVVSGLLVEAVYGLYQFYHIPPWDAYWINASQFTTAGLGYAEQVRLFGTLNSPGPYAVVLMASLIFVLVTKGPLRIAAGGFGVPAFGLALVRSAWGGLALALVFTVWRVGGRTRLRMIFATLVLSVIAFPLLVVGPVSDALSARFATLNDIQHDSSFEARQGLYESFAVTALSEPIGVGFGGLGLATKLVSGQPVVLDSGILQIFYQFGWVGAGIFVWAIGTMLLQTLRATTRSVDRIGIAGGGLFIAMVAQNAFASTFGGVSGMSLWVGLALAVGAAPARQFVRTQGSADPVPIMRQIA